MWLTARCRLSYSKALVYSLKNGARFVVHLKDLNSHDIYIKGNYEDLELQWCQQWLQAGDSFVDCGANIGYYSACLAQLKDLSKVVAVEGNRTCYKRCRKTFQLLNLDHVFLLHAILHSDSNLSLCIPDMPGQEGLQHISTASYPGHTCQTLTLDLVVEQQEIKPSLIKVDCEGAETEILKGASNLLENIRPAWLVEINDQALARSGTSRFEIMDIFRKADYDLFHISSAFANFPPGLEISNSFASWSFNMAAISRGKQNSMRWVNSLTSIK